MPDRIVKMARSPEGHVMIMYEANAHAKAHGIKGKLYAVMFNQLPCVSPGGRDFAEMMWFRHLKLYNMTDVRVRRGSRLPRKVTSAVTILARGRAVR